ncbi:hypothetical protein OG562_25175 [Streptomyces sp. NBC_01275]|uniref:hypothetical protein n=1 Tax=Streptomyces sp. NBC_01275 TaxID=2903807 RepID=UPI00225C1F00|nr:hypothetical protein [Streptomyces sp. NBC_01275]MCX4764191.1 hypothetical protein [Streptomyces sp. NBC_01275]
MAGQARQAGVAREAGVAGQVGVAGQAGVAREAEGRKQGSGLGLGLAGAVLFGAAALAVVLFALGLLKRLVRATAPGLTDLLPGGGWTVGVALGLLSVAGCVGGLRLRPAAGAAACWTVGYGAFLYVLGALPARNCRTGDAMCAYLPGTGSALLAYAITATVAGGLWYARSVRLAQTQRARERARLKRLRKKGKGKSRAARGR